MRIANCEWMSIRHSPALFHSSGAETHRENEIACARK
jgi:hypothetical protein